jgi:hypothetical protein
MRPRWLVLVGLVATLAIGLASAGDAWGDDTITPMCNTAQTGNAACVPGQWFTGDVVLSWTWTPGGTKVSGCNSVSDPMNNKNTTDPQSCEVSWPGPNGSTIYVTQPFTVQVELSSPTAAVTPTRPANSNDWFNQPVELQTTGSAYSHIASCTPPQTYVGPDVLGATIQGSCTDNAGKVANAPPYSLNYDATPPSIYATPARPPDDNGWYNHPVVFTFSGTDALSGIGSCTTETYSGPDSTSASVTGTCTDLAGNVATKSVLLRYDATPPNLAVVGNPGDRSVNLSWDASANVAPITSLQIERTPGFSGAASSVMQRGNSGAYTDSQVRNWVHYRYTITARDEAGNVSARTITVTPGPRLLGPANGARLTTPPTLRWTPMRSATYYNVQLFRGDRKVLSTWPAHAKLQLKRTWHFGGHLWRLKPGKYRWYVWPGYGRRSAARYGSMVGKGTFVVTSAKSAAAGDVVYPALRILAPDPRR